VSRRSPEEQTWDRLYKTSVLFCRLHPERTVEQCVEVAEKLLRAVDEKAPVPSTYTGGMIQPKSSLKILHHAARVLEGAGHPNMATNLRAVESGLELLPGLDRVR